jgi:hypothetical protein
MREGKAASAREPSTVRQARGSTKSNVTYLERRRMPRPPPFAEIKRGATVNLLPQSVISGSMHR